MNKLEKKHIEYQLALVEDEISAIVAKVKNTTCETKKIRLNKEMSFYLGERSAYTKILNKIKEKDDK